MIEQAGKDLIQAALKAQVSDVHLLPWKENYRIYFRKEGCLSHFQDQGLEWGRRLIAYFKYLADMEVGERRRPQSGSVNYQLDHSQVELRFSTIANVHLEESLVIRILQAERTKDQHLQTYFPKQEQVLEKLVKRQSGLILFSGPVGSGKTTTIYHLLRQRMGQETIQIITMEDPVEIYEPNFLQTEINLRAGISYDLLIKASLRHHPEILLIGEIRDEETARMVIRGALTGHLMIATIHAKNCQGVIGRLQELKISQQQLEQTLIGVVSQRLVTSCLTNHLQHQRLAIYEILHGPTLKHYIQDGRMALDFVSLNHQLRKAWAYGYISKENYEKFELV
ncbi:competence type IV pilus ATPase ComGA [Eremococcus coleocola]|uniref:ComG operon protein 1 n=1 Tax=Eremococcus coleocola ACS-139-V-Col8 TaxID=908337 RepID=E4KNK2_9LACT|nr:competence type IV pilus ATPase ComGA [Eremococcus coleocola]EFR31514.1 ComG operon protein 1 [Eremococcus coleocola ACS-139-V-Col8]